MNFLDKYKAKPYKNVFDNFGIECPIFIKLVLNGPWEILQISEVYSTLVLYFEVRGRQHFRDELDVKHSSLSQTVKLHAFFA